jgi:hypothetical protein
MAAAKTLLRTTGMLLRTTATSETGRDSRAMFADEFRCNFSALIKRNFSFVALFAVERIPISPSPTHRFVTRRLC